MKWIKRHKFWVSILAFLAVSFTIDMSTSLNTTRTAGQFATIAIIIKLIVMVFKRKSKKESGR